MFGGSKTSRTDSEAGKECSRLDRLIYGQCQGPIGLENADALRVVIEAQIASGSEGGMEQVLIGLCHGLGDLDNSCQEKYVIVGHWKGEKWLLPYIGRCTQHVTPPAPAGQFIESLKGLFGPLRQPLGVMRRTLGLGGRNIQQPPSLMTSDGFYESFQPDVLHITYPLNFVRSRLPTIVTMHDLQHRHFPEYFSPGGMQWRESTYPEMFDLAKAVITISRFCKDDIVKQYGIAPSKIYTIPLASPTEAYRLPSVATVQATASKYRLPRTFMLYPAMTYGHKNHLRLLEAIALLRAEGKRVPLVCAGAQRHYWPLIQQRMNDLRIGDDVRFVGFVAASELADIYELAQFVILPSLFEGAGLPLLEAFRARKPVACSDIAAFREYGGDAPLFFNPFEPRSIADAITIMTNRAEIRAAIASRGAQRGAEFTWRRTARLHRALYRRVAGHKLSSEEAQLLSVA
jgi:glycosyltransferase involved in cell wall biosynthesis